MTEQELITHAQQSPVEFSTTMTVIEQNYHFTPTAFINGDAFNKADTNNGSCKVFAFGKLNNLDNQTTLNLFGKFYSEDVLNNPDGDDHQNIRNFIKNGWQGIEFKGEALISK